MLDYLKYGAIIGVTALGGAYAGLSDKQETEAVLAKYQYQGADLERFNTCKVAMIKANVGYDDSSDAGGCACTVSEVKKRFPENQRDLAHALDALDSYSVGGNYSEQRYLTEVKKIGVKFNVSSDNMQKIVKRVDAIIEYCSSGASSQTPVS